MARLRVDGGRSVQWRDIPQVVAARRQRHSRRTSTLSGRGMIMTSPIIYKGQGSYGRGKQVALFDTAPQFGPLTTNAKFPFGVGPILGAGDSIYTNNGLGITASPFVPTAGQAFVAMNQQESPINALRSAVSIESLDIQTTATGGAVTIVTQATRAVAIIVSALTAQSIFQSWSLVNPVMPDGTAIPCGADAAASAVGTNSLMAQMYGLMQVDPSAVIVWSDTRRIGAVLGLALSTWATIGPEMPIYQVPPRVTHCADIYLAARKRGLAGNTGTSTIGHYLHVLVSGLTPSLAEAQTWGLTGVKVSGMASFSPVGETAYSGSVMG